MISQSAILLINAVLLLMIGRSVVAELAEQLSCPEDCDCHYYRINWVTDCSETNLTSIPYDGLDNNVYILNMNGNHLKELTPAFPKEISLRTLQLADNQIMYVQNDTFAKLPYLVDIDLSGNNLTTIDPNAFANNVGLITLELQQNPLEPIDGPFLVCRSLLYLYLSDCNLWKLSPSFFSQTPSLNTLDLSGNPLSELEDGIFDSLISLETLKLNRCNLSRISEKTFHSLSHLKTLELARNNLKTHFDWTTVLSSMARLELLDLRNSKIVNLPDNAFVNNQWLRTLILAENELADLDLATTLGTNLIHLETLDLSYCHLKEPLSELPFSNATKLKTLMLAGNRLSVTVLSIALVPLTRLQVLSLKDCGLTRLPSNLFHRFPSLQTLDISYNPLSNAFTGLLSPLENLEHLDMGYSNLKTISKDTFVKMNSMKRLILSGNKLDSLESGLFQNLTHLENLELNHCGLSRLNEAVFYINSTYPDLEELHLAGNPLKVSDDDPIVPEQLTRLKILDLRDCQLTYLPPVAFNSSRKLAKLFLSDNKLSDDNEDGGERSLEFLKPLEHLTVLDLSNNKFSNLTPKVFADNLELHNLKLVGNPWRCDCNIVDMWQWAAVERGDIGVLTGSTTAAADSVHAGSKKKKALLCFLDPKTTPIKEGKLRKPGRDLLNNVNRTWARYVREADCRRTESWKPARILNRFARNAADTADDNQRSNSVSWIALTLGTAIILICVASLVTYTYVPKSLILSKFYNISRSEEEIIISRERNLKPVERSLDVVEIN